MKAVLLISLLLIIPITSFKALGIDLSGWDDVVHWDSLKNQVKFVILRAGIGQGGKDAVYEKYYKKCKEIGMPVGAYWYAKATTVKAAQQEANYMLEVLKGKKFEYPIYYDIEHKPMLNTGKQMVSKMLKAFCSIMESHKYYCGVYSSKSYLETLFTEEVLNAYDIWLAHYTTSTSYKRHKIWQYTDTGRLSGKPGDCDLNYCYYDYPTLIKKKHFNGF